MQVWERSTLESSFLRGINFLGPQLSVPRFQQDYRSSSLHARPASGTKALNKRFLPLELTVQTPTGKMLSARAIAVVSS